MITSLIFICAFQQVLSEFYPSQVNGFGKKNYDKTCWKAEVLLPQKPKMLGPAACVQISISLYLIRNDLSGL